MAGPRSFHLAVFSFFLGLAALGWVLAGYVGTNPVALAVTMLAAVFYLLGALELQHYHRATATLAHALASTDTAPTDLNRWLAPLHRSLQHSVRLRIEGMHAGLPGPALTPYITGLLVLLGMLGTFLGMVVTLKGTGLALETATDLQAIRASLSAPVKGLGLAFGTSVAGVATSGMLGLMSALLRRERLLAGQMLDTKIATTLRVFSVVHHREESLKLLQRQAEAMPQLVDRLQAMMAAMERQGEALNQGLLASQERFHGKAEAAYAGLAASVNLSLKASLAESARIAGAAIQPVVEATMAGITRETQALHEALSHTVERQLDGLAGRFHATTTTVADLWKTALAEHRRTGEAMSSDLRSALARFAGTFEEGSGSLLRTVGQAHADLLAQAASRDQDRLAAWHEALGSVAMTLQQEWRRMGEDALGQQQQICKTLEQASREIGARMDCQAKDTMAEITRLMHVAAQAPQAAAEVVAELRQKLSDSIVRDNAMLEERSRILETVGTLLDTVNHGTTEQRAAIDALVASSAGLMDRIGRRFSEKVDAEAEKMATVAAQLAGGAAEVASLGEAFGVAVQLFNESNDKLVAHLQRVEGALSKSIARSDEQLAYYVAQAREVIDLSILSQKQIVEDLQRIASRQAAAGSEA